MRDVSGKVAEDFSRAAEQYDAAARWQHAMLEQLLAWGGAALPQAGQVLDAGCATGTLAPMAAARGFRWNLMGVDLAPGMCREAQRRMPVICADIRALPLQSAWCDAVISALCLQWVEDVAVALREFHRVLRPGGTALISLLVEGSLRELAASFARVDDDPHVMPFRSAAFMQEAARHAGFTITQEQVLQESLPYPDLRALMESLRQIGAGNKSPARRRGLMTRRMWQVVEQDYTQRTRTADGCVHAGYEVLFLLLKST